MHSKGTVDIEKGFHFIHSKLSASALRLLNRNRPDFQSELKTPGVSYKSAGLRAFENWVAVPTL